MTTTTIRVSTRTRALLQELAQRTGLPMQQILEEALEQYRRQQILQASNTAYAALQEDTHAWQEVEAERAAWDATLADGLEEG